LKKEITVAINSTKMKYSQTLSASLALLLQTANLVNAQSPPTSQPSTNGDLIVTYNGTSNVERDMLLFPDRTSLTPPDFVDQANQAETHH